MSEIEYKDRDGKPTTLDALCRNEPEWAANRITHLIRGGAITVEQKNECIDNRNKTVREQEKQIAALTLVLKASGHVAFYAQHDKGCPKEMGAQNVECFCGLDAKRKTLEEADKAVIYG